MNILNLILGVILVALVGGLLKWLLDEFRSKFLPNDKLPLSYVIIIIIAIIMAAFGSVIANGNIIVNKPDEPLVSTPKPTPNENNGLEITIAAYETQLVQIAGKRLRISIISISQKFGAMVNMIISSKAGSYTYAFSRGECVIHLDSVLITYV